MGAKPTHCVEVCLLKLEPRLHPECEYFVRLSSAATGMLLYVGWGLPHRIGVWVDDVITISFHAAKSKQDFQRRKYDDIGEVYLPLDLIRDELERDACIELAILPNQRPLGDDAEASFYYEAFKRARERASNPHLQRLSVSARWVANNTEALTARNLPGLQDLGPDEMRLLWKLQMCNLDLRAQLGLKENELLPEMRENMHAHLQQLGNTIANNSSLREEVSAMDEELLAVCAGLSEEQCIVATNSFPQESIFSPARRRTADLKNEIHEVVQGNVKLIGACVERARRLAGQVTAAGHNPVTPAAGASAAHGQQPSEQDSRRQWILQQLEGELNAIAMECDRYKELIRRDSAMVTERKSKYLQQLQMDHDVLDEQVSKLQASLLRPVTSEASVRPDTGVLNENCCQLKLMIAQYERKKAEEQEAMQKSADELRAELTTLQNELQRVATKRKSMDAELEELRKATSVASFATHAAKELTELQTKKETLVKELGRSRKRIEINDAKVQQLYVEDEDLRSRAAAAVAMGGSFGTTPQESQKSLVPLDRQDAPQPSSRAVQLVKEIEDLQGQVLEMMRAEDAAFDEVQQAKKELEEERMQAAVLDHRARLVQSRGVVTSALNSPPPPRSSILPPVPAMLSSTASWGRPDETVMHSR